MSRDTTGTASSAKAAPMIRDPRTSGLGLTAAASDKVTSPVTASTKGALPSTAESRSSRWVSRRPSTPKAMPTGPAGSLNSAALEARKSIIVSVVFEKRRRVKPIAWMAATLLGVQSSKLGSLTQPPLNGL